MAASVEKSFGRQAFGLNPAGYHAARPDYPDWVYDMLVSRCGLRPGAKVFEIGAGTGTATRRLLALGWPIFWRRPNPPRRFRCCTPRGGGTR